jgi:hypothetical protein
MSGEALGFVETRGLVAAIEACDAMLKAARVRLLARQIVKPALVTICVAGETAAVRAAVDAGARAAEKVGRVASTLVIPRPAAGIAELAGTLQKPAWAPAAAAGGLPRDRGELAALPVRQLRALARRLPGVPLGGRQISQAGREQLLDLLGRLLFPPPSR